jgi:large subunit ribosomal protein L41
MCRISNGFSLANLVQLTPFVTRKIKPTRGRFEGDPKGALSGEAYLARWKLENGEI